MRKKEKGQSIVEIALLLPVLLLMLLGLVDFGRVYYVMVALKDAAQEGAAYAAARPNDGTGIAERADHHQRRRRSRCDRGRHASGRSCHHSLGEL